MKKRKLQFWSIVITLFALVAWTTYLSIFGSFTGSDDSATAAIAQLAPTYTPWFNSVFEPSATLELVIFIAQGALGTVALGLCLWLFKRNKKHA